MNKDVNEVADELTILLWAATVYDDEEADHTPD